MRQKYIMIPGIVENLVSWVKNSLNFFSEDMMLCWGSCALFVDICFRQEKICTKIKDNKENTFISTPARGWQRRGKTSHLQVLR